MAPDFKELSLLFSRLNDHSKAHPFLEWSTKNCLLAGSEGSHTGGLIQVHHEQRAQRRRPQNQGGTLKHCVTFTKGELTLAFVLIQLWIEFDGEMGLDYGGVAREWFELLSKVTVI